MLERRNMTSMPKAKRIYFHTSINCLGLGDQKVLETIVLQVV